MPGESYLPQGNVLVAVPNMLYNQWYEELKRCLSANAWNILQYPTASKQIPAFWEAWDSAVEAAARKGEGMTTVVVAAFSVCDA